MVIVLQGVTIGLKLEITGGCGGSEEESDAFFSAFAPPEIVPDAPAFLVEVAAFALEYSVEVADEAEDRMQTKVGPRKGPLPVAHGATVSISLQVPADVFQVEEDLAEVLVWRGQYDTATFEVTALIAPQPACTCAKRISA